MPDPFETHQVGGRSRQPANRPSGDRYRVVRKLGAGSMGEVYLAEDRKLKRRVAIKSIRADKTSAGQILRRIKRESMLHAQIGAHPNIVTLYDYIDAGDKIHLVMEYVEGDTLDHVLEAYRKRGRYLPVADCLDIAIQCLRGLSHVHANGVIHRDVKPANVMLTRDSTGHYVAKIMDFGVARQEEQDPDITSLTHPGGRSPGTPLYMAPEQIDSRKYGPVTPASDLYAVGVMLYQLISGDPPFTGSLTDVFNGHLNIDPEPIRFINGTAPHPALAAAIDRALEKDSRRRFATAREFAARLEAVRDRVEEGGAVVYNSDDSMLEAAWSGSFTRWALVGMASLAFAAAGYFGWKNDTIREAVLDRDFARLIPDLVDDRDLDGPLPEVILAPSPADRATPPAPKPTTREERPRAAQPAAKPAETPARTAAATAPAQASVPEAEPEPQQAPVKVAESEAPAPTPVSDGGVVTAPTVTPPATVTPVEPPSQPEIIPPDSATAPAPVPVMDPAPLAVPDPLAPDTLVASAPTPAPGPMENLANLEPIQPVPATGQPLEQVLVVEDAVDSPVAPPQGVLAADLDAEPQLESVNAAPTEEPDGLESIQVEPIPTGGTYVIVPGDTLSRVAGRFNINVKSLAAWNKLEEPYTVRPGQQIYLYERPDLNPPPDPEPITEPAPVDSTKKESRSRELLRKTRDQFDRIKELVD